MGIVAEAAESAKTQLGFRLAEFILYFFAARVQPHCLARSTHRSLGRWASYAGRVLLLQPCWVDRRPTHDKSRLLGVQALLEQSLLGERLYFRTIERPLGQSCRANFSTKVVTCMCEFEHLSQDAAPLECRRKRPIFLCACAPSQEHSLRLCTHFSPLR